MGVIFFNANYFFYIFFSVPFCFEDEEGIGGGHLFGGDQLQLPPWRPIFFLEVFFLSNLTT